MCHVELPIAVAHVIMIYTKKTCVKTVSLAYVIQSLHCTKMPLPNLSMEFTKGNVLKITLTKVSKKVRTGAKWPIQLELLWVSVA